MRESSQRISMLWFGIVMTVIGVLGFITQGVSSGHHLVGLLLVGTAFNLIYVATGVIGIALAFTTDSIVRGYLRLVAVVYIVWAILGLFAGNGQVLGFVSNNGWDVALNIIVGVVAAGLGWSEATATSRSNGRVGASGDAMSFGEYQDAKRRDSNRR